MIVFPCNQIKIQNLLSKVFSFLELEDVAGLEEGLESESRRKRLTAWTVIWISRFTLLTDFHFGTELTRQASQSNHFVISELENDQS